jgi:hypothetical protein
MNSKILNTIGLGNIDPAIFLIIILIAWIGLIIVLIVSNNKRKTLEKKYERFMLGKDMESMEELILKRFDEMSETIKNTEKNVNDIHTIFEEMKPMIQKVGIVKYDAFHEMGGKLSFALVMLDGNNTGFVINAMHSRDGCYTYIKEIINGESYIPLGTEEKEALNQAMDIMEG